MVETGNHTGRLYASHRSVFGWLVLFGNFLGQGDTNQFSQQGQQRLQPVFELEWRRRSATDQLGAPISVRPVVSCISPWGTIRRPAMAASATVGNSSLNALATSFQLDFLRPSRCGETEPFSDPP